MVRPSNQVVVVAGVALAGAVWIVWIGLQWQEHVPHAGFWFEPIRYESSALGGTLTPADLAAIESAARASIADAFAGLRLEISDRRDATYRVRVVQEVHDPRFRRPVGVAGESRAVAGFGGAGNVSFEMLAGHAIGYAPPGASRDDVVAAMGRGIGHAAVHEFAHQLLPREAVHDDDVLTYEYDAASRREQYYERLHWGRAWPLLVRRLGVAAPSME